MVVQDVANLGQSTIDLIYQVQRSRFSFMLKVCSEIARDIELLSNRCDDASVWCTAVGVVHAPAETPVLLALDGDVACYKVISALVHVLHIIRRELGADLPYQL